MSRNHTGTGNNSTHLHRTSLHLLITVTALGRDYKIKVSHPNLYSFLAHLQQATSDQLNDDVARIRNRLNTRRPKKKANMLNDKRIKACVSRFSSSGAYT